MRLWNRKEHPPLFPPYSLILIGLARLRQQATSTIMCSLRSCSTWIKKTPTNAKTITLHDNIKLASVLTSSKPNDHSIIKKNSSKKSYCYLLVASSTTTVFRSDSETCHQFTSQIRSRTTIHRHSRSLKTNIMTLPKG